MSDVLIPRDGVGQALAVGDHVAHVTRRGSRVSIARRVVAELRQHRWAGTYPNWDDEFEVRLVPLSGMRGNPWGETHNIIKVRAP